MSEIPTQEEGLAAGSEQRTSKFEEMPIVGFSEDERALIRKIEKHGLNEETRGLLNQWLDSEEAKVTAINTSRATIELNLKRARLYLATGRLAHNARKDLEDVMLQARQEGELDLYDRAESILNGNIASEEIKNK